MGTLYILNVDMKDHVINSEVLKENNISAHLLSSDSFTRCRILLVLLFQTNDKCFFVA